MEDCRCFQSCFCKPQALPTAPHPSPQFRGVTEAVWPEQKDSFSLQQSVETTAAFQTPPQEKGCRHGSTETPRKIPRGGCDSVTLGKRGCAEQQRTSIMSSVVFLVNFGPFQGPNIPSVMKISCSPQSPTAHALPRLLPFQLNN